jgi:predicted kinase
MKKNPKLLILVGPPGSGKSTFAKYHIRTEENWFRICRDDLRLMQFNQANLTDSEEANLSRLIDTLIESLLKQNINVIIDATNTRKDYLNQFIKKFNHMADISFKVFQVDENELKNRVALRHEQTGKYIPKNVLKDQIGNMNKLLSHFDFSDRKKEKLSVQKLIQDETLAPAIICDLDGTLAYIDHRNPYDASDCEKDGLNGGVAEVLTLFHKNGNTIILLSGRMNKYRPQTEAWLAMHQIPYDFLYMRESEDFRKDSIIKKELFDLHIENKFYVKFILDDRNQVVDMWRKELGLSCFQVNYGDF